MDRMAPEVLCSILEYSTWGHKDAHTAYPLDPTLVNLKALRLCCRDFAEHGAKYLFSQLWVYLNEASFIKMMAIAEHPIYSQMVQELTIFPRLLRSSYDKDEYERIVRALPEFMEESEDELNTVLYTLSTEELDAAYGRFTKTWEEQMKFSSKAENGLLTGINYFTKLHSITPGDRHDFAISEMRKMPSPNKNYLIDRLFMLPHQCWEDGVHTPEDAISIIRAIASSPPLLSGALRGAEIFEYFMIDFLDSSAEDLELLKRVVTRLTYLGLAIHSNDIDLCQHVVESGQCRQILEWSSPKLERLSVTDPQILEHEPFADVFGTIRFPRLSSLALDGFWVHGDDLIALLQRHKPTLKSLQLRAITLKSASWLKVFTELRGGALTFINFHQLRVSDAEEEFLSCACGIDGLSAIWRKAADSYIVEEQTWPSLLPAFLSRNVVDPGDQWDEEA